MYALPYYTLYAIWTILSLGASGISAAVSYAFSPKPIESNKSTEAIESGEVEEAQAVKEELEASNRELEKFVQNLEEGNATPATAETEKSGENSKPVESVTEPEKTDVHQVRES